MKVVFPLSAIALKNDTVSDTVVSFDSLLRDSKLFRDTFSSCLASGNFGIHFGDFPLEGTSVRVCTSFPVLSDPEFIGGVVVRPAEVYSGVDMFGNDWTHAYDTACKSSNASVIAISAGEFEFSRLKFIKRLVDSGKFCSDKVHWLYGTHNPAELAVYKKLFSSYVLSRFEYAVCSTTFIYSMFGVAFSESTGVYRLIPNIDTTSVGDLGTHFMVNVDMSRAQRHAFEKNKDTVLRFGRGEGAEEYAEWACAILSEGG